MAIENKNEFIKEDKDIIPKIKMSFIGTIEYFRGLHRIPRKVTTFIKD